MGLRFRNRIRLVPGVYLNLGLRGVSLNAGIRGASVTAGTRGIFGNVGLPGTGLSFRSRLDGGRSGRASLPAVSSSRTTDVSPAQSGRVSSLNVLLSLKDTGEVIIEADDGRSLSQRELKFLREKSGDFIRTWLENEVKKLNATYESVVNIHLSTPPSESPRWLLLPAFDEPMPTAPEPPTVRLVDRVLFRRRRIEAGFAAKMSTYRDECRDWDRRATEHLSQIDNLRMLGEGVAAGRKEAMEAVLGNILSTLPWPRETEVTFEIDDGCRDLHLDVDLPEIEDMPSAIAAVAGKGIRVNFKKRSEGQLRRDYSRLAHGAIFRVAGEAFANLPTISQATISGFTQRPDVQTGHVTDQYVLSVRIDRHNWEAIDFTGLNNIDPVEALSRFELVRAIDKSGRLRSIEPMI
jgi:hypothetical protein